MANVLEQAFKEAFGDLLLLEDRQQIMLERQQVEKLVNPTLSTESTSTNLNLENSSLETVPKLQASSSQPTKVRRVSNVIAPTLKNAKSRKRNPPEENVTLVDSLPNASTLISDPLSFILESFDTLISPQIQNVPNASSASLALRRSLYRKHFATEASKELASLTEPIRSIEQLIPVIISSSGKCGLVLF